MFADKTIKLGRFKQDGLAREPDTLETAFVHPAHDRRAMNMPQMLGGFAEGEKTRTLCRRAAGRIGTGRGAARSRAGWRGFTGGFHGRIDGSGQEYKPVNPFTTNIAKQKSIVNNYSHHSQFFIGNPSGMVTFRKSCNVSFPDPGYPFTDRENR